VKVAAVPERKAPDVSEQDPGSNQYPEGSGGDPSAYPPPPPSYGAPGPGYPPPNYGAPHPGYYASPSPDHPQATTILVLGILSIICCGLFTGIPAIVMGRSALAEIDASPGRYGSRGSVKAGLVCGIIGTAWSALMILIYGAIFAIALSTGEFSGEF
jgi:hypothetical protein